MNLIYMCVFYNEKYIRLLELLFLSLKRYSSPCDILILTSDDFKEKISALSSHLRLPCKIHCLPCTSIFEAACARLHVFDWDCIDAYDKILYLDTDIIVRRDLGPLFVNDIEKKLYGIASGTLESPQFGGQFFDWPTCGLDHTTPGVNSGTLFFRNCPELRSLFEQTNTHIKTHVAAGLKIPAVMDQPFINYTAFMRGMCDTSLLMPYVSLYEDTLEVDNEATACVCHFSFPIGNFEHKYRRMSHFFKSLLITPYNESTCKDILGKQFSWEAGYIRFLDTSIETTWGNGVYSMLDTHVVYAVWNNYYHVIKFNVDFTEYMSVRTAPMDFECIWGMIM